VEVYSDEFVVSDNYSMEDIKHRVKYWLASPMGKEYLMEVVSDRHVILTKAKHDMKICCYGCIAMIASIIVLVMIMVGFGFPMYNYAAFLNAMMAYVAVIGIIMALTVAVFCLRPEKAVFELRFGTDIPIQVYVQRSGEVQKSAYEYASLKDAILGGYSPQEGPSLGY
jgi:hypothetical protein